MNMRLISLAFAIAFLMFAATPAIAQAPVDDDLPPSVTVQGVGRVFARPDMAQVNIGVVSQAPTAAEALTANNSAMSALMTVLKQNGVADKDILTSNFSVNPVYDDRPQTSSVPRPPRIVAYRVENTVTARVRNLASLGTLLDAVVRGGANNINGISFTNADDQPILDNARKSAVADARRKAELYAAAAGIKLGRVLYINESGGHVPVPMYRMGGVMGAEVAQSAAPIATGEQEMTASVQVVYAIEP